MAEYCDEFKLPFDLMIGVNRGVYAAGVHQGRDLYDSRVSLIQYRELFNEGPDMSLVDEKRRYQEWVTLQKVGHARSFKRGFTFARYKSLFGESPPKQSPAPTGPAGPSHESE